MYLIKRKKDSLGNEEELLFTPDEYSNVLFQKRKKILGFREMYTCALPCIPWVKQVAMQGAEARADGLTRATFVMDTARAHFFSFFFAGNCREGRLGRGEGRCRRV